RDVLVAELLQRLRAERRAGAAGAVDDDLLLRVRCRVADAGLEEPARDVHRAGDVALFPLLALADVDEEGAVAAEILGLGGGQLRDLGLDLRQQFSVGRHWFRKYSDPAGESASRARRRARRAATRGRRRASPR